MNCRRMGVGMGWVGLLAALLATGVAQGQPVVDSLVTWQGYNRVSTTHAAVYRAPAGEERRPHTVVLTELAQNRGPSTAADVRYLADRLGRAFGIDPAAATWVIHWGAFSYEGARPDRRRELLLRVTFRRTSTGRLGNPSWRLIGPDDVRELTDRRWVRAPSL